MSLTIPDNQAHTTAFVAALESVGWPVGRATGKGLAAPYFVVYADPGVMSGPLGDRFADLTQTVVLHSFGVLPEQAEDGIRRAREVLLPGVRVPGRNTLYVTTLASQPVQRDDDADTSDVLYLAVDVYRMRTSPA